MKSLFQYLSKVFYILESNQRKLIVLLLAFIASSILEAVGIGLIGPFINIAANPNIIRRYAFLNSFVLGTLGLKTDAEIIITTAIFVIGIFCIKSLIYFLCKLFIYKFSFHHKVELEARLVHTYLHIPYLFHLNRNSASLIKNIIVESNQFTLNCLIPLLETAANVVVVVILLALLAKTDLILLSLSLLVLLPVVLLFTKLSQRANRWGQMRSESQQQMIRAINHGLGGIKETKIVGCEDYFERDLRKNSQRLAETSVLVESFQLLPRISIETLLVVFLISLIAIAQIFWADSSQQFMSVLGIFAIASMRMVPISSQTLNAIVRMRASSYALNMLYFDLKEIEKYAGSPQRAASALVSYQKQLYSFSNLPNGRLSTASQYEISLENLVFTYPSASEPTIRNLSLSFKQGESIAFIGQSGAGKTTLVDILLGLIIPDRGDIYINGISIYTDLRSWQNMLGYIPQSIFLTDESIEENIAFGVPSDQIDPERLQKAIKAAQLQDLIHDLPDGIKTPVGERGVRLSGGQRQRIGIARALYHEREVLVLDEATSALDSETERLVCDAINSLAGLKTLVIIAHRTSTIKNCDRVYSLGKGEIIRSGKYEEVA